MRVGTSTRPGSRSTASAARASRRSPSRRWASCPGQQDLVVAGGVESMSRPAPMHVDGFTANNAHLFEQYAMVPQGISADLIATTEGFSREDCDRLAVDSQDRCAKALAEGRFDRSLVPIFHDDGTPALDREEFPRPGTTLDDLAKLAPSFEAMGAHVAEGRTLVARPDGAARLPARRRDPPRPSRRQLLRRRRRRGRRARGVGRLREGARPHASRPASSRPRSPGPSR